MLVGGLEVDHERAVEAGSDPALLATDAAEVLVREGVPFREAYERVAGAVRSGELGADAGADKSIAVRGAPGPGGVDDACRRPGASGIDLRHTFEDVAAAVGTPFYAYDGDLFRNGSGASGRRSETRRTSSATRSRPTPSPVVRSAEEGLGADIVSGGELEKALRAGVPVERIVFSGIGKRREEIRAALEAGVRSLNVESLGELEVVAEEAAALGAVAPVSVRLNPTWRPTRTRTWRPARRSKFGLRRGRAFRVRTRRCRPLAGPGGLSFHVGSQLLDPEPVHAAAKAAELWRELDLPLRDLDVGGGLGIGYGGRGGRRGRAVRGRPDRGRRRARRRARPGARRWLGGPGDLRDASST